MGNHISKSEKKSKRKSSKHSLTALHDHTNTHHNSHRKGSIKRGSLSLSPTQTAPTPSRNASYVINGRRYQNISKKYVLPHDDKEQDRLTQVHFLYKHLFDSNFSAPVKDLLSCKPQSRRSSTNSHYNWFQEPSPPKVLDIACGNGTWVLEMAAEFPNSQFYGIDIVANYPSTIKPANAYFSQMDILNPRGLPYPDEYFDYIHMRQVYSCFSEYDWEVVVREIKRLLKPGGYIEVRDVDPVLKNVNDATPRFFGEYPSIMKKKLDINIFWARYMFEILKEVGEMTEMQRIVKRLEFNTTGPVGDMIQTSFRSALDSYKRFFLSYYEIPEENYENIINTIINNAINDDSYFNYYCCWGRKSLLSSGMLYHQDIVDSIQRKYSLARDSDNSSQLSFGVPLSRARSFHIASYELSKESHRNPKYSGITDYLQQRLELVTHPFDEQIITLAADSVNDIDQFSAGYED